MLAKKPSGHNLQQPWGADDERRFSSVLETSKRGSDRAREALQDQQVQALEAARKPLLTYKQCRERGLPIGSSIVEGGIRIVA
jgi:hypothetical protein